MSLGGKMGWATQKVILLGAVLAVGAAVGGLVNRADPLPGMAVEDGMGDAYLGVPVMVNDRIYLGGPAFKNRSPLPLTIRSAKTAGPPGGIELVDVRLYRSADFEDSPPLIWAPDGGLDRFDPGDRRSESVIGRRIAPGDQLADEAADTVVLLEFRAVKPGAWRWPGTEITYQQAGLTWTESIGPIYEVKVATSRAQWTKYGEGQWGPPR